MSKKETWSYSFEWTQPYVEMQGFFDKEQKIDPRIETSNELARLDFLEEEVQNMLTYPDAEAIIKKITKGDFDD
tara:strand:- start:1058 stop:1279 length:222 start_codon:yes stop_codon:yes gene_type:complete